MGMVTPAQAAANWVSGMQNAAQAITNGVNGVTQSPTEAAALAVDRQVQGVIRAAQSGKTAQNLRNVSLSDWKQAFISKGIPTIAARAAAAKPKMVNFLNKFMPYMSNVVQQLPPRGDLQTNIQRAVAVMNAAAAFPTSGAA